MATKVDKEIDALHDLRCEVEYLREEVLRRGADLRAQWGESAGKAGARAINLSHYVALRGHDLADMQHRLAARGLSSLGRCESDVIAALDALVTTLRRLTGQAIAPYAPAAAARTGAAALETERERVFGPRRSGAPRTRVIATLPMEAATDPEFVDDLISAGMDCARINCANDDPETWGRMIANVRAAASRLERPCRILMDIAGPKCRIAKVKAPPKTRLGRGDRATIVAEITKNTKDPIAFSLNYPELVDQLTVGAEVFLDDGKAAARVTSKRPGRAELEVYASREKGMRLKPGRGVHFPSTEIDLPPLTSEDFRDLDFVAEHADLVGFSFVQSADDIELLQDHLTARAPDRAPHTLVLKIETPLAVKNLPRLILQSAAHNPTAVMIVRGYLAVEIGFARLTEMPEELLSLCEAAHTPVVWATQVLDGYVRDGVASRAEMTDAAMAQGADCVVLNKGPYLTEGVAFLRDVLNRLDRRDAEKFPRPGSLKTRA